MSHAKIIVCLHSAQKFYDTNKQIFTNLNKIFKCVCDETYRSHRLFFFEFASNATKILKMIAIILTQ